MITSNAYYIMQNFIASPFDLTDLRILDQLMTDIEPKDALYLLKTFMRVWIESEDINGKLATERSGLYFSYESLIDFFEKLEKNRVNLQCHCTPVPPSK
ncbi:hypothetical protein [Runella zeae]|uniref:hypothetical protein n=1 Tax=Runella zeae TaxID=94255 RepID=UPI00048C3978|nr:hypothetical protein [Runella zeae]